VFAHPTERLLCLAEEPAEPAGEGRRSPDRAHPQILEGQWQGLWLSQAARRSSRSGRGRMSEPGCATGQPGRHQGPDRVLLEVPGGNIDPGEEPIIAAQREVLEETGYEGQMTHIVSSPMSAYSTAVKHVFLMADAKRVASPMLDANEDSHVVLLSRKEFERNAFAGNLTDLDAAMAVLLSLGPDDAACG